MRVFKKFVILVLLFNLFSIRYSDAKPWYSFDEVIKICSDWKAKYPKMVEVDTFGQSMGNKPIIIVYINCIDKTTPKQRFFLTGSTHGNEKIGTEICMRIMKELLEKYDSDPKIKTIVDRSEFSIIPVMNPDGFCSGSSGRRTLNNGKDPDRAGGFKLGGKNSDGSLPYQWPELKAMYRQHVEAPTYFGCDYHCGTIAFLLPFFANSLSGGIMDAAAFKVLSKYYPINGELTRDALNAYNKEYASRGGGVTNDNAYGKNGSLSTMPEVCMHYPAESKIDGIAQHNLNNVIACINELQKGVCGVVRDARSKVPLYARVKVKDNGCPVFSSPTSGAYYKYIPSPSGTIEVTVFSNGYKPQTKTVSAVSGAFAKLDFEMEYDKNLKFYALSTEMIGTGNSMTQQQFLDCLEMPDGKGTPLSNGFFVVDLGPYTPATHKSTNDITVHGLSGEYTVSASMDPNEIVDKGKVLGTGNGKASFDLSKGGLEKARFIRVEATGSATIDAIEAEPSEIATGILSDKASTTIVFNTRIISNSALRNVTIQSYIPQGRYSIHVFDIKGKMITSIGHGYANNGSVQSFTWNGKDANGIRCSKGTYVFVVSSSEGSQAIKAPIVW